MSASIYTSSKLVVELGNKVDLTTSLYDFTEYVAGSIYTEKLPLNEIYSRYTCDKLENQGFLVQLRTNGLNDALKSIEKKLPENVLKAMNIKVIELPGYEADDILGTLAKHSETVEDLIVYQSVETGDVWVRPKNMWNEVVDEKGTLRFTLC